MRTAPDARGLERGRKRYVDGAKRNHQKPERKPPRSGGERLLLVVEICGKEQQP